MNIDEKVLHCNLLARGFLAMYKEDGNEMNNNLNIVLDELSNKLRYYVKKGFNLEKEILKAYDKFTTFADEKDTVVKALPFALRFIVLNPKPSKELLKLALIEEKNFKFSKDPKVAEAKELVRKFLEV